MTDTQQELSRALSDRYEVLAEIGRGGFATVYAARDLRHGSRVAIKVLRPELAAALGAMRFTREVQITARLQHPHILPLLDSGEANGAPFYVMPFVEGETLKEKLVREGPLAVDEAVRLIAEVADGLAYAHAQGFVHRDIKPGNILLSQGHAVLADFGVARALDVSAAERITDSGLALGTVQYMSPEQASGDRLDGRSDVYALGCVLYELLVGAPPFTGPTIQMVMARHAVEPPPGIRSVRATVSVELEDAVFRALAKVPTDRFATAASFREEILRAATIPSRTVPVRTRQRSTSTRRIAVVAGAVVAAVAGIGTWLLSRDTAAPLDQNRVLVYPLALGADWPGSASAGEDVATMIGSAVDGAGPLRWIDAWQLLSPEHRSNIGTLSPDDARALAERQRTAFTLSGRVIALGADSATVQLELRDVAGDSVVGPRAVATAPVREIWRAGLAATTQLLPRLIRTGVPDVVSEWATRSPTAVAHFLLGESAFRRVQLDSAEQQFGRAVASDSTFGLAAIRGAQAATWNHDLRGAATLIDVALRSRLSARHEAFARGYQAFLQGRADSAVAHLDSALALDSASAFVWMQLGEVYAHLLPVAGNTDSLELSALERAYRLDSTATNVLFHLIEVGLRHGDTLRAGPLLTRFLAAAPDTVLARELEVMDACVRGGAARTNWLQHVALHPEPTLAAAMALSAGGRQATCAIAGFEATLQADTAATTEADSRRWYALAGLHGLLLARGDTTGASAQIDAFIKRWGYGSSLYLLDNVVLSAFTGRGETVIAADAGTFGADFAGCSSPLRCWALGLHLTKTGRAREATALAARILALPKATAETQDSLLAASLRAHIWLAQGDTTRAVAAFQELLAAPRDAGAQEWDLLLPMGAERLALAHVMLARGDAGRAVALLDVFDSRALGHAAFVGSSLELRARAAEAAGDARRAALYRTRLAQLQQP